MKVFKLNDCDWYMANTLEEAIQTACDETGIPRDEMCDGEREVTEEEMGRLKYTDDGGVERTFSEELGRNVAAGKGPMMFASTEF